MFRWLVRNPSRWVQGLRGWVFAAPASCAPASPVGRCLLGMSGAQMENLLEVQVPEDVEQQLQQLDSREQEQCEQKQQERELMPEPQAEGLHPPEGPAACHSLQAHLS